MRKALPRIEFRKTKVVVTLRGRVIFSTYRCISEVYLFLDGFWGLPTGTTEVRRKGRYLLPTAPHG